MTDTAVLLPDLEFDMLPTRLSPEHTVKKLLLLCRPIETLFEMELLLTVTWFEKDNSPVNVKLNDGGLAFQVRLDVPSSSPSLIQNAIGKLF